MVGLIIGTLRCLLWNLGLYILCFKRFSYIQTMNDFAKIRGKSIYK